MNIYRLCAIENTRFSPMLNYSDTAKFYQCPQTHLQCSPNCEFHTPNSPFVPPTVIRGKYIAVMWMYSVIILILHGSYTKSLELWNDNLIIQFDFLIGTDICSNRLAHFGNPSVYKFRFILFRFVSRFISHFTGTHIKQVPCRKIKKPDCENEWKGKVRL